MNCRGQPLWLPERGQGLGPAPTEVSEVSLALGMPAVAIDLNSLSGTFARGTTVFAVRFRWATTGRIFTRILFIVSH